MVSPNFPVPERIPGQLISDHQHLYFLKQHLATLCGLRGAQKFPGSQPVSFTQKSLELLETEDFWVCEKSDGVRVMVLIVVKGTAQGPVQEVYFIDRKDEFFLIENITFPHFENPNRLLKDTILDGELVIDVDPKTGHQQLRFLAFDCIVWEANNLMMRPLMNRYGRLKDWVIAPLKRLIGIQPQLRDKMPFDVQLKTMELAYGIDKVLHYDLPKLTHGNDGLIFTSATAPYRIGTDPKILKWKPPSENSIDFRLELRFPPLPDDPTEADFYAKPLFVLMMNCGKEGEQFFDTLEMTDEEWIERKERREQLDNRVVEVVWDASRNTWKILRFRDDKKNGNYRAVVFSILDSIRDGVEAPELSKRSVRIRKAWKARAQGQSSTPQGSGNKSPPRGQQQQDHNNNHSKPSASKSPPRNSKASQSKSPPHSRQSAPPPAASGGSAPPPPKVVAPSTVPIQIVGGNPRTKGKKKKITLAQVGSVAATMKRI
ncbi:Dcp1p-Dcp2p decapping enzyme complex alpha subunit [Puccinia graminis f. sp. tritici]|uniref:mRNA-capping enzyme subunit alpha n=1 Tax=Puccinia graminis f. sp. tritici TaxID=56615 RepID=A0A5B0RMT0_PUCGR|nr:Dcp1p-Dcp2p decapping enzyme complex alpha subunit [Puccinia graminis f. sp. tritici]KAA1109167.1 Dcp1p-Dcp2p decapping enzyme complex alpha subunit [Puccinia graminis f. sp. tritici]KAA1127241.1 Dcp1p-Dcp2p decapping enzyme complex alpha subunit [Puccinia graminis f. sp. tritici]